MLQPNEDDNPGTSTNLLNVNYLQVKSLTFLGQGSPHKDVDEPSHGPSQPERGDG